MARPGDRPSPMGQTAAAAVIVASTWPAPLALLPLATCHSPPPPPVGALHLANSLSIHLKLIDEQMRCAPGGFYLPLLSISPTFIARPLRVAAAEADLYSGKPASLARGREKERLAAMGISERRRSGLLSGRLSRRLKGEDFQARPAA